MLISSKPDKNQCSFVIVQNSRNDFYFPRGGSKKKKRGGEIQALQFSAETYTFLLFLPLSCMEMSWQLMQEDVCHRDTQQSHERKIKKRVLQPMLCIYLIVTFSFSKIGSGLGSFLHVGKWLGLLFVR